MRKTDKKRDKQLRLALSHVCEISLKKITGFEWLTHLVDYDNVPKSLKVICIFDTNENRDIFLASQHKRELHELIQAAFDESGFKVKRGTEQIAYDTKENSQKEHKGKWALSNRITK